jgi:hypothetical protein
MTALAFIIKTLTREQATNFNIEMAPSRKVMVELVKQEREQGSKFVYRTQLRNRTEFAQVISSENISGWHTGNGSFNTNQVTSKPLL